MVLIRVCLRVLMILFGLLVFLIFVGRLKSRLTNILRYQTTFQESDS